MTTWAGLIASLAFIQHGWKEQTKLDSQLLRANKVIAELIEIYENWKNQVDDDDDYKILVDVVQATEQVLWSFQSGYNQTAQRSMLDFKSEQFVAQEISEAIGAAVVYVPTIGVNFVDEPSGAVGSEGVSISDEYESELREGRGTGVRTFETYNGAITSFEKIEAEEDLPTDTLVGELQEGDEYEAIEVDEADVLTMGR